MRLIKPFIPLAILFVLFAQTVAANESRTNGNGMSALATALDARNASVKDESAKGSVPELTQAEKQLKMEQDFQSRLTSAKEVLSSLEQRVSTLRRATVPPTKEDLDSIKLDLTLLEDDMKQRLPSELSPLVQVQWSELNDRIFQQKLALEVMTQRWDSGGNVFGIDFFNNAKSLQPLEGRPVPDNYRVRVRDNVQVVVLSKLGAQDGHTLTVDNSGCITLPGIGRVVAMGKTTSQLEQLIAQKVGSRFSQLRVQVTVVAISSIQVQVSGEVVRPGTYAVNGLATLMDALCLAGGPSKSGTFRKIQLVREGEPKRAVDLYDFFINGSKKQDWPLKDGDLVFVPPVGPNVTIGGEVVRPARYEATLPSTLGAIIKLAGGTKSGGYLHAVQVERVIDNEYKVLLSQPIKNGDLNSTFPIVSGDQVTVSSIRPDKTNKVSISGPVKAPGLYGFQDGLRVADLVKMAQGFTAEKEIYGGRADILRLDPLKGTDIVSVNLDKALKGEESDNIILNKLDQLFIYSPEQVVFRPKMVTLGGAVARPGTYKRSGGMKISDAVAAAGGVLPYAYLNRADLVRLGSSEKTELIRVDLQAALNGDPSANIEIQDRDQLSIYTYEEVKWQDRKVRIEGAVQRPGFYIRSEGMKLSDLLFAAGGLLPEAGTIVELSSTAQSGTSVIREFEASALTAGAKEDPILGDNDLVTIRSVNPYMRSPQVIYLTGEVANPGPYALTSQDEKLADVIKRAGGLTKFADVNGLLFLRDKDSVAKPQQYLDSDMILKKTRLFADKQFLVQLAKSGVQLPESLVQSHNESVDVLSKPVEIDSAGADTAAGGIESNVALHKAKAAATATDSGGSSSSPALQDDTKTAEEVLQEMRDKNGNTNKLSAMGAPLEETEIDGSQYLVFGGKGKLLGKDKALVATNQNAADRFLNDETSRISVNLFAAIKDEKCPDNMTLQDGDRIYVPKTLDVVTVIGAVLHPHAFAAGPGKSVRYFIDRSGGYSEEASKGNVVVVRTNGDALPANVVKSVLPGDIIVVPTTGLIDISKKYERVGGVTKVVSDILSSIFILTRF